MVIEPQSHHVVDLALMPVRRRPDIRDGIDGGIVFRNAQLEPQMNRQRHRVKLVDDLEARLVAEVIHARDVEQIIEGKFVATKLRHFPQIFARES